MTEVLCMRVLEDLDTAAQEVVLPLLIEERDGNLMVKLPRARSCSSGGGSSITRRYTTINGGGDGGPQARVDDGVDSAANGPEIAHVLALQDMDLSAQEINFLLLLAESHGRVLVDLTEARRYSGVGGHGDGGSGMSRSTKTWPWLSASKRRKLISCADKSMS